MIGFTWNCPACGKSQKITENGVRCSGRGHLIYESLQSLTGYFWSAPKKKPKKQTELW